MNSPLSNSPRIAVLGAGVIGQVYASLLHRVGAHVTLLARGSRREQLHNNGVNMLRNDPHPQKLIVPVPVADAEQPPPTDIVLLAVRTQQLPSALEFISSMGTPMVVTMMHLTDQQDLLERAVGHDRIIRGFPGIGGYLDKTGQVVWAPVRQQPTTLDAKAPNSAQIQKLLSSTGLKTIREPWMTDWLNIHTIFITCLSAAIVRAGGSATQAAGNRQIMHPMVQAIRQGFRAYRQSGGRVRPRSLAMLFGLMPSWFAAHYWQRELQGTLGRIILAPHTRNNEKDEVPLVWHNAKMLLEGTAPFLQEWVSPNMVDGF